MNRRIPTRRRNNDLLRRRDLLGGVAAFLLAIPVRAAIASTEKSAVQFIRTLGDKAVNELAPDEVSAEEREKRFRAMLRESFDVKRISRFALGRYARRVSKQEMAEFSTLYEDIAVLTYAHMFASYAGQGFTVLKQLGEPNARYIVVVSQLSKPDGSFAARLDWQLLVKKVGYAVVDIRVEGVSMAIAQRDEFTAYLDKNNGNMKMFLGELRKKVDSLREKRAGK